MPIISVTSVDDARLTAYRNLPSSRGDRREGRFVVEGRWLVERMLASWPDIDSLLVEEKRLDELPVDIPAEIPIYSAPSLLLKEIIGFHFHRGILGCGRRRPTCRLLNILNDRMLPWRVVVSVGLQDPENLGGLIRNAAAFGATAVVVGHGSADPFSRRVLRVSMGNAFRLPIVESDDLPADLLELRDQMDCELLATTLSSPRAEPLHQARCGQKLALLFGNEGNGLADEWLAACQRHVTIPMYLGTDSLNVSVASGIFLYHFALQQTE